MPEVDASLETSAKCRKRMRQSFEAKRKGNENENEAEHKGSRRSWRRGIRTRRRSRTSSRSRCSRGKARNEKQFEMSEDKCNLEACFYREKQRGTMTETEREKEKEKERQTKGRTLCGFNEPQIMLQLLDGRAKTMRQKREGGS